MPPKAASVSLTLRLKSRRTTVVLVLPGNSTLTSLKTCLANALNETNVLNEDADDDLPVPASSFETSTSSKQPDNSEEILSDSIRLAIPNDKGDLGKGWAELTKGTLDAAGVKEYSILAFTVDGSDDFDIDVPTNEDPDDEQDD
jgi:hypothetical protein